MGNISGIVAHPTIKVLQKTEKLLQNYGNISQQTGNQRKLKILDRKVESSLKVELSRYLRS